MIDTAAELRQLASEYLAGGVTYDELDATVANLSETLPDVADTAFSRLIGAIELLLAERSSGHLDLEEFSDALMDLAPMPVRPGARQTYTLTTVTSSVGSAASYGPERVGIDQSPVAGMRFAVGPA